MNPIQRITSGPKCSRLGCNNFSRRNHETCRHHDPEVLAARADELERQAAELRSAVTA